MPDALCIENWGPNRARGTNPHWALGPILSFNLTGTEGGGGEKHMPTFKAGWPLLPPTAPCLFDSATRELLKRALKSQTAKRI